MKMSTTKVVTGLTLLFSLFLTVGCSSDESTIKNTAQNFMNAMKDGDLDGMAEYMTADARKELDKMTDQEKEMTSQMMKGFAGKAEVSFGEVTVSEDGDSATIMAVSKVGEEESEDEMPFVKEDGKWCVSDM